MKKRFWVYTTILALILTFSVLFVSVYAALSQNISIKNTISFAGTDEVVKFSVDAKVTGTKNDEILKTSWKYDYDDLDCPNTFDWDNAIANLDKMIENEATLHNLMFTLLGIDNPNEEDTVEYIDNSIRELENFMDNLQIHPDYEKFDPNISK